MFMSNVRDRDGSDYMYSIATKFDNECKGLWSNTFEEEAEESRDEMHGGDA